MKMQESGENYLETILILKNQKGYVRSIDIAQHLQFSKPSVSRAMSLMRKNGYVVVDGDGNIELTEAGREIAERMYERHRMLTEWLIALGVSPDTAAADACRIEHVISTETFEKIKQHVFHA
ncbi:MAG TPA: metal-dependent transcriptional regulator [Firmicutes bacterium]|nr:metal-dependent transcriptional regulator [Bacillota bacterium]